MVGYLLLLVAVCSADLVRVPLKPMRSTEADLQSEYASVDTCTSEGIHYQMEYNTTGYTGESIIDLSTAPGVRGMQCDIDGTKLRITFNEEIEMFEFVARIQMITDFIVVPPETKWAWSKCAKENEAGFLLRRVIGIAHDTSQKLVTMDTIIAKYDELYKDATISYSTLSTPCSGLERHPICIGVNTEQGCDSATSPITIFQNKFLSLTCPDCFLGFSTNLFMTAEIQGFKLVQITAGFKNMSLAGNLVFDLKATADWSANIDKTVQLVPPTTLVSFKLGPIPFSFSFAVPVNLQARADFDATAEAKAGVTMTGHLGDDYNMWTKGSGWTHVKPDPKITWARQISGQSSFSADAHLAIVPTIQLMVSRLYEYDLTLDPQVNMLAYVEKDPLKLCANFTTQTTLTSKSQLNINIPWLDVHSHDTWGPTTIYDSGTINLGHKCISADESFRARLPDREPLPSSAKEAPTRRARGSSSATFKLGDLNGANINIPARADPFVALNGTHDECVNGQLIHAEYDTYGYGDSSILNLDDITGLQQLKCDIDETGLLLVFTDQNSANDFAASVVEVVDFLTGGGKFGCNITKSAGGFMLRRIIAGQILGNEVELDTTPAKYDEIYQDATLNFKSIGACPNVGEHGICIGINTEQTCTTPTAPIPVVSGKFITMTCSDCFLGFMTHIFMEVRIEKFKMLTLSAGFRNMSVNGALVMDMKAEAQWSQSVDKTLNLVPPVTLFAFNIGKVPFSFGFAVPVELTATAMFDAVAEATIGATTHGYLGDNYVTYTAGKGWTHVKPNPKFEWTPQVSGHQDFNAEATFSLVPKLEVKLANIYEYDLTFTPLLDIKAYEQKEPDVRICANVTSRDTLTAGSSLNINVPWLDIHSHDTWGPTVIYDSGIVKLAHKCTPPL